MKKLMFASVAMTALALVGAGSSSASAGDFAIHFAGRGFHVDIGDRHGHHGHHRGHRSHRSFHRGHGHHGYHGWGGGGHVWHDTSHWDYHPGELVPHYDHYHYIPSHY